MNDIATQKTVSRIGSDTIEGLLCEDRTLFIAVLRKDPDLLEHLRQLMDVAMEFREEVLVACYTLEDLLPYFTDRFGVGGTPTYLVVRNGTLLGSLLGKNSRKNLLGFIREHLDLPGEEIAPKANTGNHGRGPAAPVEKKQAVRGVK